MVSVDFLISQLGGPSTVAKELGGLAPNAVSMWAIRGTIPWKWHGPLRRLAKSKKVLLSEDVLVELATRRK